MQLKFTERAGKPGVKPWQAFTRDLLVTEGGVDRAFHLEMETVRVDGRRVRVGTITNAAGAAVWTGKLPDGPPPTRAFALAAGLCDENGNSDLPLPEWAV